MFNEKRIFRLLLLTITIAFHIEFLYPPVGQEKEQFISTYNLIIMRTSFMSIPDSLEESARIDGAKDFTILFKIIIPLSLPLIVVMVLFYGVGHWNSWFSAMIYLRKRELYPLQLILREILISNDTSQMLVGVSGMDQEPIAETIKYASEFGLTGPYVSKIFKDQMGEGIQDYINKVRLNQAKVHLLEEQLNLEHIARKVGYSNSNGIVRVFKKYEGVTPGQFREINR